MNNRIRARVKIDSGVLFSVFT